VQGEEDAKEEEEGSEENWAEEEYAEEEDGREEEEGQVRGSRAQEAEQPSPEILLLSSHCSPASR